MDQIVYIENGAILEMGNYEDLIQADGLLNDFVKSYFQNRQTNIDDISI